MWDVLLGGVTGLIGTIWSGYNQRKIKELEIEDRKAERQHDLKMVEAETAAMVAEAEANIKITEAQIEGAVQLEDARAFTASQAAIGKRSFSNKFMDKLFGTTGWTAYIAQPVGILVCLLFGCVDTVKDMARPAITAYLLGVSTWVTYMAWQVLETGGVTLSATQAETLILNVISTVLYLTSAAVTWWFGDRMAAKGIDKILSKGIVRG